MSTPCVHIDALDDIRQPEPGRYYCEQCVAIGDTWVHLRTCQTCGSTLCCDSSKNKHATRHFRETGHPVVASAEPGEYWLWCYSDEAFREYEL